MFDLSINFIISQVLMFFAIIFNFLSMQFKERKNIYVSLSIAVTLIGIHLILLNKITAAIIVFIAVIRFGVCIFSSNRKWAYFFIILNTVVLFFTYSEILDIILYIAFIISISGNFQKDKKLMRKQMLIGTLLFIVYYTLIISPMAVIAESIFFLSQIIGYYRFYIKK